MKRRAVFPTSLMMLFLLAAVGQQPAGAAEPGEALDFEFKAHRNVVRRTSAEYLSWSRRMSFYYDFDTATELARETGRPLFVIFCRAGTIDDPLTGKPRCAS